MPSLKKVPEFLPCYNINLHCILVFHSQLFKPKMGVQAPANILNYYIQKIITDSLYSVLKYLFI